MAGTRRVEKGILPLIAQGVTATRGYCSATAKKCGVSRASINHLKKATSSSCSTAKFPERMGADDVALAPAIPCKLPTVVVRQHLTRPLLPPPPNANAFEDNTGLLTADASEEKLQARVCPVAVDIPADAAVPAARLIMMRELGTSFVRPASGNKVREQSH